jgi:hypothetical protein
MYYQPMPPQPAPQAGANGDGNMLNRIGDRFSQAGGTLEGMKARNPQKYQLFTSWKFYVALVSFILFITFSILEQVRFSKMSAEDKQNYHLIGSMYAWFAILSFLSFIVFGVWMFVGVIE